jgi:hypothetical protein
MKFEYICWARNEETNTDKVWGIIQIGADNDQLELHKYVTFWGRRGKKLQTKVWDGYPYEAETQFNKKKEKGYQKVNKNQLSAVYPEFEKDLEKTAVWGILRF